MHGVGEVSLRAVAVRGEEVQTDALARMRPVSGESRPHEPLVQAQGVEEGAEHVGRELVDTLELDVGDGDALWVPGRSAGAG